MLKFQNLIRHLNFKKLNPDPGQTLQPRSASLSSTKPTFTADKCIDGKIGPTENQTSDDKQSNMCHTYRYDLAPWLALDYGVRVSVEKVVLFNRRDCYGDRTRNVEVRLTEEKPNSSRRMFTGGHLIGKFVGPATNGQRIEIKSGPGWKEKFGRFVTVQMDKAKETGDASYLNLEEVTAFGKGNYYGKSAVPKEPQCWNFQVLGTKDCGFDSSYDLRTPRLKMLSWAVCSQWPF